MKNIKTSDQSDKTTCNIFKCIINIITQVVCICFKRFEKTKNMTFKIIKYIMNIYYFKNLNTAIKFMILQDHSRKSKNRAVDPRSTGEWFFSPVCFSFPVTQSILLVTLLSPNVWAFFQTKQFSTTQAGGFTTCSDTVCLEMYQQSMFRFMPPVCPPLQMPVTSSRALWLSHPV